MTSLRWFPYFCFIIAGTAFGDDTPATFPFEPAQLLAVLPAVPADWKVIRSEADTSLGEWLETRATRTFQPPSPIPTAAEARPPTVGEVEVSVIDTAGFTPSLAAFANFIPGKNGSVEKKHLGSLPAIVISGEDGRQLSQVLVSARYIVEITLTHASSGHIEDWLRRLRFDLLPPVASTPTVRPREFRLTHVDELHPETNHSYLVSTTSSRRVQEFLKTLPLDSPATPAAQ